ncbi:MAG TPA: hypothetical protein VLB83_04330 [Candidatus Paceibacterota bacterium]|nr:hypothetical protein [Candidatus Paceibacterota bacterium]
MPILTHFFPSATDDRIEKISVLLDQAYAALSAKGIAIPTRSSTIYPTDEKLNPQALADLLRLSVIAVAHLTACDPRIARELPRKLIQEIRSELVDCT